MGSIARSLSTFTVACSQWRLTSRSTRTFGSLRAPWPVNANVRYHYMRYYFAIIGIALLGMACWLFWRRFKILMTGVTTTGRVESYESREFDESISYLPVISFTDQLGNRQRFTASAGGSRRTPPIGTTVKVRYDNENPKNAVISSFLNMWAAPIALAVLGVVGLLAFKGR